MTPRVFLTGGSGYLGRNLVRHFVGQGAHVVALARTDRAAEVVRSLGATPFAGDLQDPRLADGIAGCAWLVHAAADTRHGRPTAAQSRTNEQGTRNVVTAARAAGVARLVHVSSESVLLDGSPLIDATEDLPYPARPAGGYARSKGAAERIALSLARPGFAVMVVRPRFVWGRDDSTALPHLVAAARAGKLAFVDGGRHRTSTTHVANACEGVALALARGRSGEVYFISDGPPIEFREFVTRLLATRGIAAPDRTAPGWLVRSIAAAGDLLADLTGGRLRAPVTREELATSTVEVTLDIRKARTELGYRPIVTREQGLAELAAAPP